PIRSKGAVPVFGSVASVRGNVIAQSRILRPLELQAGNFALEEPRLQFSAGNCELLLGFIPSGNKTGALARHYLPHLVHAPFEHNRLTINDRWHECAHIGHRNEGPTMTRGFLETPPSMLLGFGFSRQLLALSLDCKCNRC